MLKFLSALAFAAFVLLLSPSVASAQQNDLRSDFGGEVRHAYQPTTVQSTRWMRARVNNITNMPVKRLVCVEAFNNASSTKTHLGCLWVDLSATNSTTGMWAAEFDAPTAWLRPGHYTIVYTYQDQFGNWNRVTSMTGQVLNGVFHSI